MNVLASLPVVQETGLNPKSCHTKDSKNGS